ncbi:MAG: phosphate/phosphite/phosphonate ABC transporter substrate-binding protein [Mycoplasmatales bacterium]
MNKIKMFAIITVMAIIFTGCGTVTPEEIKISFVPSAPAEDIMNATEPLEGLIQKEMAKEENGGYDIQKVSVDVGTSYEAVGEALASGTTDIGFIPGGTYVLYEDQGVEPILTATRKGLSKDSDAAKDWNDGKATKYTEDQVTSYRSIIVAGPSDKGQELADKVNSGKDLTFADINSANICLQSPSSSSGYLYPAQKLGELYDKKIADLESTVEVTGYGDALGRLAAGQCDVTPMYADARMDYVDDWTSTYGRDKTIWEETNVIGVTDPIMNDTISISQNSPLYSEEFIKNFQNAMIAIAQTDAGKEVISIYSHEGYQVANPDDYEVERQIQEEIVE